MKARCLLRNWAVPLVHWLLCKNQGTAVVHAFIQLQLSVPSCTWHGERDRIVEVASVLANSDR
jgi:3-carboxy-cis,cis-muconate cycloisomerase